MLKLGYFVAALQAFCAVALLATSAWLISRAAEMPPVMYLMVAVVGVRAFALGRAGFRYGERVILHDAVFREIAKVRPLVLKALIPFAPAALGRFSRGGTMAAVVNDVDELQNKHLRALVPIVQSVVVTILAVVGTALLVPAAALALLIAALGAFLLALPISAALASAANESTAESKAQLQAVTVSTIENYEVLKAYGWLDLQLKKINELSSEIARADARSGNSAGVGTALITALSASASIATLWFGATATANGQLSGVLLAVVALLPMAVFEIIQVSQSSLTAWRKYRVSQRRVTAILQAPIDAKLQPEQGLESADHFANLELQDVSFGYDNHEAMVFEGLYLKLNAGEKLAIVGPSGAGKSTIAYLLLRFIQQDQGEYIFNGKNVANFQGESIRRVIGYLEQSPTIFLGTVRQNLLIAKPNATDAQLTDALQLVKLEHMFSGREGLDTQLGERGLMISGGEAQRLALARALLANFEVLILDEPTANVDLATANELMQDIYQLATTQKQTIVLITHDRELAKKCNRTIELQPRAVEGA